MDSWKKFDETSLPEKEAFYSNLNVKDITDVDYRYAEKVFKNLNNENLGEYHGLYVHIDTLLLADVFENFRKTFLKVYELDPAQILSAPGLACQSCLMITGVKPELLIDPEMLLMVEKGIRGGICHAIHRYAKANNKYMKNYDENNDSWFLEYLDATIYYMDGQCQNHYLLMVLNG